MKNEFINLLTTLRDAAPSISLTRLGLKSPEPSLCTDFAKDTTTPTIEFSYGKCSYKVNNTWEHFDYLIRQHKRLSRPQYGSNIGAQNHPRFRTRRQAEQGFSAKRTLASKVRKGDIIYTTDTLTTAAICTEQGKHLGLTLQQLGSLHINHFETEIVKENHIYLPPSPAWFLLADPPSPQALRLIKTHNPDLFKLYMKLRATSSALNSRIQSRIQSRMEERERKEALQQAELEAEALKEAGKKNNERIKELAA